MNASGNAAGSGQILRAQNIQSQNILAGPKSYRGFTWMNSHSELREAEPRASYWAISNEWTCHMFTSFGQINFWVFILFYMAGNYGWSGPWWGDVIGDSG